MNDSSGELSANSPFGVAAQLVLDRLCDRMMANLPGTMNGEDIKALHDMRVASRRLRSALRVFCSCFPKKELEAVASRVGIVTRALGNVRDQDVLIDYLLSYSMSHPTSDIGWIADRESRIRQGARVQMLDSLSQVQQDDLQGRIGTLLSHASMTSAEGKKGRANLFHLQAPSVVGRPLAQLYSLASAIDDPGNISELHQMRIAAKRLRYTLEAFLPCFGKPVQDLIADIKLLQECLGQIHDCDVWIGKLRVYLEEPGLPDERVRALQQVLGDRSDHREAMYRQVLSHWKDLAKAEFPERVMQVVSSAPAETVPEHLEAKRMRKVANQEDLTNEATEAKPQRRTVKKAPVESASQAQEQTLPESGLAAAIAHTKEAAASAVLRLGAKDGSGKLMKQFDKLNALLDELPDKSNTLQPDDAAKVERWLGRVSESLSAVPEDGKLSDKDRVKLRDRTRLLRRKIADKIG